MSIANHIKNISLKPDQEDVLKKIENFLSVDGQVFFLKGYAGTGKTTLIKGLANFLIEEKKSFEVMAPTGRAAKILREKTGRGITIHRGIYNFEELQTINADKEDEAEHSFRYLFPVRQLTEKQIIIIDEASMVQAREHRNELFDFGTNIMLNDLLTYASLNSSGSKIIFVGDPGQLPPFGETRSVALDKQYFIDLGYRCDEATLTTVNRQHENLILKNAMRIRDVLESEKRDELKMKYDNESYIKIKPEDIIEQYAELYPSPKVGDGVIINFSNAQCHHNNKAIREKIFPGEKEICPGDIVIVGNNNYQTFGVEIFNGDMALVTDAALETFSESALVYCEEGGKKIKKRVHFTFRNVKLRFPHYPEEVPCTIIDSLLNSTERDLSVCEMKGLYINFMIRFNEEQKKRFEGGWQKLKVGSEEFKLKLRHDPYFNSLRVKYGYSTTCHKAQGGEWETVFVDYFGRVSLRSDSLRWCYTATTRANQTLFALNAPHFGKFDQFSFSSIVVAGKIPNDALNLEHVAISPLHAADSHKAKSLKYWEISEKLRGTQYRIENVESLGGFQERYTISDAEKKFQLDGFHKGSGHFIDPFKVISAIDAKEKLEIENIVNRPFITQFPLNYTPRHENLEELYSVMQSGCESLGISITNIIENKFDVTYYLITDNPFAAIKFCFDQNYKLSTAMPRTLKKAEDAKLIQLTQNLLNHARA